MSDDARPLRGDVVIYAVSGLFAMFTALTATLTPHIAWGRWAVWGSLPPLAISMVAARSSRAGRPTAQWLRPTVAGLALLGTVVVPLGVLVTDRADGAAHLTQSETWVIEGAGARMLHTGSPYRQKADLDLALRTPGIGPRAYVPYGPPLTVLGMPSTWWRHSAWADARVWFALTGAATIAAAAAIGVPGDRRVRAVQLAILVPPAALTIATGGDDLAVIGFALLALALASRRRWTAAGLAIGIAVSMKYLVAPVAIGLAVWTIHSHLEHRRNGIKSHPAARPMVGLGTGMVAAMAVGLGPTTMVDPRGVIDNLVRYPLGLARTASTAASALPGHLIATGLPHGTAIDIALLLVAVVGLAWWVASNPPDDAASTATFSALGLLALIVLAPSSRFGYLWYPIAIAGWGWALHSGAGATHDPHDGQRSDRAGAYHLFSTRFTSSYPSRGRVTPRAGGPGVTRTSVGRRAGAALVLAMVAGLLAWSAASAATTCSATTLNVVAHMDDDLLFLSPDLLNDVRSDRCVRTVVVTASDAGQSSSYWLEREAGGRDAYNSMLGTNSGWTSGDAGIPGHPMTVFTSQADPRVSLVFMRLPDGNPDGSGSASTGFRSLQKLWNGSLSSIPAIDGTSTYTKASLVTTLRQLMESSGATTIRTQDWTGTFGDEDHSDHHAIAYFARSAHQGYTTIHQAISYRDYETWGLPQNVTGTALTRKRNAFYAYAAHDPEACGTIAQCQNSVFEVWLGRQYIAATESGGSTTPTTTAPTSTTTMPATTTTRAATTTTRAATTTTTTVAGGGTIPSPVDGGWTLNGNSTITGGALQLTSTATGQRGSAFWPTPVTSNGLTVTFDAEIGGGTGADGMTLTLANPTTSPTALGALGGGLGYAGITGTAITLDTWKNWNSADPTNNFVGLATGYSGDTDNLTLAETNTTIPNLRTATHTVTVTVTTNHINVKIDGTTAINRDVTLTPTVLVGFTAGSGDVTDRHAARNITITTPDGVPPTTTTTMPATTTTRAATTTTRAATTTTTTVAGGGTIPSPVDGGWTLNGNSTITGGALQLTSTATGQRGSAFWPTPVTSNGLTVTFDAEIGGGTGADGMTLTLANPTTSPTALGALGGGLGYAGITGTAITLDTWKNWNSADPTNNFVGLATGYSGDTDNLTLAETNTTIPNLRTATHTVTVTVTTNHINVKIDGTTAINRDITLTPTVLVGFTAGSGDVTDRHAARNITITTG